MRTHQLRTILFSAVASVSGAGCIPETVDGSGQHADETREVATFSAVAIADSLAATISLAADQPQVVEIDGDDNLVRLIRSHVEQGKLVIDLPPNTHLHPKLPLHVTITAATLTRVEATDSAQATADVVDGASVVLSAHDSGQVTVDSLHASGHLAISASDSGRVKVASAAVAADAAISATDSSDVALSGAALDGKLAISASDSSSVVVDGQAAALQVELADSSHCDAAQLSAEDVVVHATDSSTADVCATHSIALRLTDSSHAAYSCDPSDVTQDLHDGSSVERH